MTGSRLILCVLWVLCGCMRVCVCKVELHGHVQSPLYPKPYPADLRKQWDLEVPPGYQVQLTFNYLDIEPSANCFYDHLLVLHGQKLLGKFCGQDSSDPNHPGNKLIMSPSNRLQLVFVTDESNEKNRQHLGFSAFYQAVDIDECSAPALSDSESRCSQICLNTLGSYLCTCHHGYQLRPDQRTCELDCGSGVFTELDGVLSSPGYPNPTQLGLNCNYTIDVQPGFHITLDFNQMFHIEQIHDQKQPCIFHWLQVSVPGEAPKKFCGDKSPGVINTHSHSVELLFHTDGAGESRGFSLTYTTNRVECKIKGITNGKITPDFPKYFYRDYIHVRCDTGYKLMMGDTEIKSFRTMCQDDGTWHLPLPQCKIIDCGSPKNLLNGYYTFVSGLRNEYGSIIQYYCHEPFYKFNHVASKNVTVSCAADRKWKTSEDNEVLHCLPVCGRPTVDLSGRGRILKGVTAKKGSFPWQVFLLSGGRGGAMVIGEQWLLTAAHNLEKVTSPENLKVHVGSIDVGELVSSPSLPIESLHVHPGFKLPEYNNDIALIKLKSPITFNEDVMPVCLPEQGAELQKSGWVSGFGVTEDWASSNYLRYISLPIVDQRVCKASLDEAKMTHDDISALTENMFCAGLPEGGEDTCQGDSGSAFVMKNQDEFYAVGIVSWGVDCGKKGRYGMYTHVARYANWIKEIIKGN